MTVLFGNDLDLLFKLRMDDGLVFFTIGKSLTKVVEDAEAVMNRRVLAIRTVAVKSDNKFHKLKGGKL